MSRYLLVLGISPAGTLRADSTDRSAASSPFDRVTGRPADNMAKLAFILVLLAVAILFVFSVDEAQAKDTSDVTPPPGKYAVEPPGKYAVEPPGKNTPAEPSKRKAGPKGTRRSPSKSRRQKGKGSRRQKGKGSRRQKGKGSRRQDSDKKKG